MRYSFYDDPEYKKKQAKITREYWQKGTFNFKRKPLQTRTCKNPNCQLPFPVKQYSAKIFCSRSCAAQVTNLARKGRRRIGYCLTCGKETKRTARKYCSNKCQNTQQYLKYITRWRKGLEDGIKGIHTKVISSHIRRYLLEKYIEKCSICGWDEKHQVTGVVPLEVDHIDGNWENNHEINLRLLCPNCHALTPNFRNLNKGNGRTWRLKNILPKQSI